MFYISLNAVVKHSIFQARSTRSSRETCCPRQSATLPKETSEMRKDLQCLPWQRQVRPPNQF